MASNVHLNVNFDVVLILLSTKYSKTNRRFQLGERGESFARLPLFESFSFVAISNEIKMVRKMEMAREMEMD